MVHKTATKKLSSRSLASLEMEAIEPIGAGTLVGFGGGIARKGQDVMGICFQDVEEGQVFDCHYRGIFVMIAADDFNLGDPICADDNGQPIRGGNRHPFATALNDPKKGERLHLFVAPKGK